jgi:hypothetical protein
MVTMSKNTYEAYLFCPLIFVGDSNVPYSAIKDIVHDIKDGY